MTKHSRRLMSNTTHDSKRRKSKHQRAQQVSTTMSSTSSSNSRRGPGRPPNPPKPVQTGPPRAILPAPMQNYGAGGRSTSVPAPPPPMTGYSQPARASYPPAFQHGPTMLPPQPYAGGSHMNARREHHVSSEQAARVNIFSP